MDITDRINFNFFYEIIVRMGNLFRIPKKTMIILRGLPGSGKTTLARTFANNNDEIYSTHDYFLENGKFKFQRNLLRYAHWWNQERVLDAAKKNKELIIINNINIKRWESKPYVKIGLEYGYDIIFYETNNSWSKIPEECKKRDFHGTPLKVIKKMATKWEDNFTIETIMASKPPWEN